MSLQRALEIRSLTEKPRVRPLSASLDWSARPGLWGKGGRSSTAAEGGGEGGCKCTGRPAEADVVLPSMSSCACGSHSASNRRS